MNGKQNAAQTYSELLFSLKEEGATGKWEKEKAEIKRKEALTPAVTWMNLEDITLSEISKSQKDEYCVCHLNEVLE